MFHNKYHNYKKYLVHLPIPFLIGCCLSMAAGYRHLWQDEIETAERARTIVEYGVPMIIGPDGKMSLNTGGKEIIDSGNLHRYTPWGQFYVAASGLFIGNFLGNNPDAAVRVPFIVAHSMTSFLYSFALVEVALLPVPAAILLSTALALQTIRMVHNRTARYHAWLDFLFMLGLVSYSGIFLYWKSAKYFLASSIFFLPQIHTLGGSLLSFMLGVLAFYSFCFEKKTDGEKWMTWKQLIFFVILPGLISFVLILICTTPWAQPSWGANNTFNWNFTNFGNINDRLSHRHGTMLMMVMVAVFFMVKDKKNAIKAVMVFFTLVTTVKLLDINSFSQPRYYMAIPLLFFAWPFIFRPKKYADRNPFAYSFLLMATLLFILWPDLVQPLRGKTKHSPWHGVKLVWDDIKKSNNKTLQPLHSALGLIAASAKPGDEVLFEYVPQFVNWYLPKLSTAFLPDPVFLYSGNINNPVWKTPIVMPKFHLFYNNMRGYWPCGWGQGCSFAIEHINEKELSYMLENRIIKKTQKMCIMASWRVDHWNNAPFRMAEDTSLNPEGYHASAMHLSKVCDGQ